MIYLKIDTFQCRHKIATGNDPEHSAASRSGLRHFFVFKGYNNFLKFNRFNQYYPFLNIVHWHLFSFNIY